MNSIVKHQKISQEVNCRQFQEKFRDRLTNLPSCHKTKIISRLPTIDAVRTSILSRKWKLSWTSVTNLDFDDMLVGRDRDGDEENIISEEDFIFFVNRVLLLRERSCLQRFRMSCNQQYKGSLVNTWIAAILLCHVREIDLIVSIEHPGLLTSDIFTCKTLVVLKLVADGDVNMPSSVCLPHLKTLHLAHLELSDDLTIRNLLSGCPVLEELKLSQCIGVELNSVNIIAPALVNLTLEDLPFRENRYVGDYDGYEIVLETPALKFLNLSDDVAKGYVVKNLDQLKRAIITFEPPYSSIINNYCDEFIDIRTNAITNFLKGISHVQSLVLPDMSMQAIRECKPALPIFSNMTSLELTTKPHFGWRDLPKLLKKSPSLETLILHQETNYDGMEYYLSADEMRSRFLSHLKVITIDDFEGREEEMRMVEYFLENAKILEKLTIDYHPRIGENDKRYKELLMLKRGSNACKVEVL